MTLEQLAAKREAIQELAALRGARNIRIFGSVARNEAGPDSDVDVLADFEPGRTLIDVAGFELDLEDLLGCKVDLVEEGGISPYMEGRILAEAVAI
jgi:predicted nucleotidyltransferase